MLLTNTQKGLLFVRFPIRRLLSYYRPHRTLLIAVLAAALSSSALTMVFPLLVRYITNVLLAGHLEAALPTIYRVGALMVLLVLVRNTVFYFVDYKGHELGARIENALRAELFSHLQRLSFGFYDRERTGQLMSRLTNDFMLVGEFFHHVPEDYLTYLVRFVGAFVILALIDLKITLVIFGFLPVVGLLVLIFNRRLNRTLFTSRERIADVNARAEDSLAGIRVVQSFTNEPLEIARFHGENRRFLESRKHTYRAEAYLYSTVQVLVQVLTVVVVVMGSASIVHRELNLGDLITYLLYVAYLTEPLERLAFMSNQLQEGITGFERFLQIRDLAPAIVNGPHPKRPATVAGRVEFQDVTFRYQDTLAPVLQHLNLIIAAGEYVALVGPSGAGKSTLCSLIPRFYDVTGGRVLLDNTDVREIDLETLRRNIGLVPQDVYLFAGTVMDNLQYGNPNASVEEVLRAARDAEAHDFIMRLPNGYDSEIGQRGVTLSGGQRQRLAIARVLLKNPPVVIFDEATSALDHESETRVQQSLERIARARTTIVIAHRLSTIRNARRILVLTADGLAEAGPHAELLERGGVYANFYSQQLRL